MQPGMQTGTPGMTAHPPIPITELAQHIERLKANDSMLFFQEYEVIQFVTVTLNKVH
jgi:hypothetical protein